MLVVADAAPLIFLGKIGMLSLIQELFSGEVVLPSVVRDEVIRPPLPPDEERTLLTFLQTCRVVEVDAPQRFATGLSVADNSVLTLAVRDRADLVVSDDGLLRRLAAMEQLRVIGTLGILLQACKNGRLESRQTSELLEELIQKHGFRISIEVYNAVLKEIRKPDGSPA